MKTYTSLLFYITFAAFSLCIHSVDSFGQVVKTTKRIMLYPRPSLTALPTTVIPKNSILRIDDKTEGVFWGVRYNRLSLFMHEESKNNCIPADPLTDNIPSVYKETFEAAPSNDLVRATEVVNKGNKIQRTGIYGIAAGIGLLAAGINIDNKSNYGGHGKFGIGLIYLGGLTIPLAAITSFVGLSVKHGGQYKEKKASLGFSSEYTLSPTLILVNNERSLGLSLSMTF